MRPKSASMLVTGALVMMIAAPAAADSAREPDPIEPHMERLSELLERLPGELAIASERMSIMVERLQALLPADAELDAALTQFRLFLDGLYLRFSGEVAPIPGYREVRERVLFGDEPAEKREAEGIEV